MYKVLEGLIPYLYFIVACFIVALVWCAYTNREFLRLLFGKHKSIKRFKGKGKEVLHGEVVIFGDDKDFYLQVGAYTYKLLDTKIIGKWNFGKTKCLLSMEDKILKIVCFSESNLFEWYHKEIMKHAKMTFIPAIGVQVIWSILLKMLESHP